MSVLEDMCPLELRALMFAEAPRINKRFKDLNKNFGQDKDIKVGTPSTVGSGSKRNFGK